MNARIVAPIAIQAAFGRAASAGFFSNLVTQIVPCAPVAQPCQPIVSPDVIASCSWAAGPEAHMLHRHRSYSQIKRRISFWLAVHIYTCYALSLQTSVDLRPSSHSQPRVA